MALLRNPRNLKVFTENATKWWSGKEFQLLRAMNELRVPFIVNNIGKPLDDCKILDVGCGGGILSEPLSRLGANVLGIDPVFESINQAQIHAQKDPNLGEKLKYKNCNIDDLSSLPEHHESYDGLVASEVLEHVDNVEEFLHHCTRVIKPNGNLFLTTINQTPLSWLGVIFFGEYVLRQLPKGTHQYDLFVNVKGLRVMLERMGYHVKLINGFMYDPIGGGFHWTPTTLTHYALHAVKVLGKLETSKRVSYSFEQRRYLKRATSKRPRRSIDRDELMLVIPIDEYETSSKTVMTEYKEFLDRSLTTKATTTIVERLKIYLDKLDESLELRDIAQISMKGSSLVVINLSTMPDAIKPTLKALTDIGNLNPQVEVNTIYLQVPRVTREHREAIVIDAKKAANKAKDTLKSLFSLYSKRAKGSLGCKGVSDDLVNGAIEHIRYDVDKGIEEVDAIFQRKSKELLNER